MLQKTLIDEIDRLVKAGWLSQRQIAQRLGVSRGTVSAIASGRRGLYGAETAAPLRHHASSEPARCTACGYRVFLPCQICRAREEKEKKSNCGT
jgi:transcriptional regulator with XRE-family HTH domain